MLGEKHYTAWVVDGWMSVESPISPITRCSNIMEQAIRTCGLPQVYQILFRGVQIECDYGGPSAVKLATVM